MDRAGGSVVFAQARPHVLLRQMMDLYLLSVHLPMNLYRCAVTATGSSKYLVAAEIRWESGGSRRSKMDTQTWDGNTGSRSSRDVRGACVVGTKSGDHDASLSSNGVLHITTVIDHMEPYR